MNDIQNVGYKLEWVDHLFEIYSDFGRRNDPQEWFYFLRRPELVDADERRAIAGEVMKYILKYEHISRDIVELLEETFHYTDEYEYFTDVYGVNSLDYYRQVLLGREELPPYRLFEDIHDGADYDGFLDAFSEFYTAADEETEYVTEEEPGGADAAHAEAAVEEYREKLEKVRSFGIKHPYIALLESEYYALRGDHRAALDVLSGMEDGYHKFLSAGCIYMETGYYEEAEEQFTHAFECREGGLDRSLISGLFFARYYGGRPMDALDFADRLEEQGYGPFVEPLKKPLLEALGAELAAKAEQTELSEDELLMLCEAFALRGDQDQVIKLCNDVRSRGYSNGRWTVYLAEAYFGTGETGRAADIIDECYNGKVKLGNRDFNKIRTLKAKLLFAQHRTAEAYELIEALCSRQGCRMEDIQTYAQMCAVTGRIDDAIKSYGALRFNVPENPEFSFQLGKCLMEDEKPEPAHELFRLAAENGQIVDKALYFMAKASIDAGDADQAKKEIRALRSMVPDMYTRYLEGQIAEIEERYRDAEDIYYGIIQEEQDRDRQESYLEEGFPEAVFVRYFAVMEENGARVITMVRELNKALAFVPGSADLWVMLGEIHENSEYHEERAKECYERAHDADPYSSSALISLIEREMYEDNWQKALEYCDEVILNTRARDCFLMRAGCELELGLDDGFAADIAEFLRRGGSERDTYELCSMQAVRNGDYKKAEAIYEKKLKTRPAKEKPCFYEMAVCMCKQGRYEEAISFLKVSITSGGRNPEWLTLLMEIQMVNGHFSDASKTLGEVKKAGKLSRLNDGYMCVSARLAVEAGKMFKARCMAESAASSEGEQLRAIIYTMDRDYRGAAKILRKLISKEPFDIDNYGWLSMCLMLRGKTADAEAAACQGIDAVMRIHRSEDRIVRPDHLCQYGFLMFLSGDRKHGFEILDRVRDMHPCYDRICSRCYEVYTALGICYALDGRLAESEAAFAASLEIRPHNAVCRALAGQLCR